jgi:FMN-dependent NADH-azoreductase
MTRLLYIEASPRGERSASAAAAQAALDAFRAADPDAEIDRYDLWSEPLPEFDGGAMNAARTYRLMGDALGSEEERRVWEATRAVFDRFAAADAYLIATPMWNFSVPYRLKQVFDVMAQPGLAFTYTADGPVSHLTGRSALIVVARGGAYPEGTDMGAMDHQLPWLRTMLGFVGVTDVETVTVEPTVGDSEALRDTIETAARAASEAGRRLADKRAGAPPPHAVAPSAA